MDQLEDFSWPAAPVIDASVVDVDAAVDELVCDPESQAAFPAGKPVWTAAQLAQCAVACPDAEASCLEQQCPGRVEHLACLADSLDSCLSQPGASCRTPWQDYVCCSLDSCDATLDQQSIAACIAQGCATQLTVFTECVKALTSAEEPCVASAAQACLLPEAEAAADGGTDAEVVDGGVDGDAGVDAGADAEVDPDAEVDAEAVVDADTGVDLDAG